MKTRNFKNKATVQAYKLNQKMNEQLKLYQQFERMNGSRMLPTTDVDKLGVMYTCLDPNDIMSLVFFDRSRTTSIDDVRQKTLEERWDIVGEDGLLLPAQMIGPTVVPNWDVASMFQIVTGTVNFSDFVQRFEIGGI